MTPPDSGEPCNATLGEDRVVYQCSRPKGHIGQHRDGNVTAWDRKPDSGEREVRHPSTSAAPSVFDSPARLPQKPSTTTTTIVAPEGMAVLPLSLAQRILAALEREIRNSTRSEPELHALAAELRDHLPREPK